MTIVKIVNDPEQISASSSQIKNHAVLGINALFDPIHLSIDHLKWINVYLEGEPKHFINSILWNQYYNSTMLKEAYHFVSETGNSDHSFLKINGKTYRLFDSLSWNNVKNYKADIQKCKCFSVQGFQSDGTMRKINFQIGKNPIKERTDIIFQYVDESKKAKTKRKSSFAQSVATTGRKRALSNVQTSSKMKSSCKSETQKKKKNPGRQFVYTNTSASKSNLKSSLKFGSQFKAEPTHQYDSIIPIQKDQIEIPSIFERTKKTTDKKEEVISEILQKKDSKIHNYKTLLKDQDNKYSTKIYEQEQQHKIEIEEIKADVSDILTKYRKKNKEYEKENQCLNDLNVKLMNQVEKLQQKLQQQTGQLQYYKKQSEDSERENKKHQLQVEKLNEENRQMKEQHRMEKQNLMTAMKQKQKKGKEYRCKYEQMMENMRKLINVGVTSSPQPFSSKENIL